MQSIEQRIRRMGWFLRRRDLLGMGYTDRMLRQALGAKRIFRVRQGWYSVPAAPESAVRAVRVGGRLTGVSALHAYGIPVPRQALLHVAVPSKACRLRSPNDRHRRLDASGEIALYWNDRRRSEQGDSWRVPIEDALLAVLQHESREVAVACASALMRRRQWSRARVAGVFERAPTRVRCWLALTSELDDSHGESFVRLWLLDAGIVPQQQVYVPGAGRLDFRVSPHTYVEVDGAQHDPSWTGDTESSYERDHDRDAIVAAQGGTTLRYTYRQLYSNWPGCLAAIKRTIADDLELVARRARDPILPRAARPRSRRKRRRNVQNGTRHGGSPP